MDAGARRPGRGDRGVDPAVDVADVASSLPHGGEQGERGGAGHAEQAQSAQASRRVRCPSAQSRAISVVMYSCSAITRRYAPPDVG